MVSRSKLAEKRISIEDQGSLQACEQKKQIPHIGRVLCGLRASSQACDSSIKPGCKKHGTYLKSGVPAKISHDDVAAPAFIQADTVAHCGRSLEGGFIWNLTFTDILAGWKEE